MIKAAIEEDPRYLNCREAKRGRWAKSQGLRRYRCGDCGKDCGKTINALTATALAQLRIKDQSM